MPAKTTTKPKKPAAKPAAAKAAATKTSPIAGSLKKGDHVFLVDGSGYIFRAYHALPPLTRKSDGLQINAVLGFCNMLWKLLNDMKPEERPTHLAVVFDKSEKTFRTDFYPQYKAHRPDVPSDLIPQFPLIRDAVKAFDIPCLEQAGFEADDIIATYARLACEAEATATIVSSDKDLMQLVNDCVTMYDTMKDKRIGPAEVVEKFGVGPDKVIEVQALIGDSTDNVPGVPGIGVKTAAQLITEYGDLETLLSRAGEIKQDKRRQTLIDNAELARVSKRLVTLDQNVKLEVPVEDLAVHEPDYKNLIAFLKAMEFSTLTRRVAEKSGIEANEIVADAKLTSGKATPPRPHRPPGAKASIPYGKSGDLFAPPPQPRSKAEERGDLSPAALAAAHLAAAKTGKFDRGKYETVRTLDRLNAWMLRAKDLGVVALDTKTTSADPMTAVLCGVSLAVADNEACYVPIGHRDGDTQGGKDLFAPEAKLCADQISEEAALAALRPVLEDPSVLKVGQDLKYHWQIFARHGIEIHPYDDTMLMSYVLDAGRGKHNMDDLAEALLGYQSIRAEQVTGTGKASRAVRSCDDREGQRARRRSRRHHAPALEGAEGAARRRACRHRLRHPGTAAHFGAGTHGAPRHLDRPPGAVAAVGRVRPEAGRTGRRDRQARRPAAQSRQPEATGRRAVRLDGPAGRHQDQDRAVGDRRPRAGRTGRTGPRAAAENSRLAAGVQTALDLHRSAAGLRQRRDPPRPYVYALAATTTGRLSSSEPNLQNIPVRTEEGRKIRRAFIAEPGTKLVSADYSQIELRLLAEVAEVPALRKAFRDGLDIHAMTASEMFGVPVKDMPGEVRRRAKAINFGIIYGISAFGLANQLAIPRDEASAYIKKYFERFPGIRDYMEETKAFAKKNGYVLTLFGRKCHYPDIAAGNPSLRAFNERAAINARLQGSAADIIRRAMVRIEPALTKAKLNAKMLLQVHDELIFEVPEGEVAKTLPVVKRVMEDAPMPAVSLSVPLQVDARAAHNWDEAH